jgi:hypothetical protein
LHVELTATFTQPAPGPAERGSLVVVVTALVVGVGALVVTVVAGAFVVTVVAGAFVVAVGAFVVAVGALVVAVVGAFDVPVEPFVVPVVPEVVDVLGSVVIRFFKVEFGSMTLGLPELGGINIPPRKFPDVELVVFDDFDVSVESEDKPGT